MVIGMIMMTITMITTAHGFLEENLPPNSKLYHPHIPIRKHFLMILKAHDTHDTHDNMCVNDRIRTMMMIMASMIGVPRIR